MILIGLVLFCLSMTAWAARNANSLMVSNATMMVRIPVIGGNTSQILEDTSTLGDFFFAAMIHGLALRYRIYGQAAAREAVNGWNGECPAIRAGEGTIVLTRDVTKIIYPTWNRF